MFPDIVEYCVLLSALAWTRNPVPGDPEVTAVYSPCARLVDREVSWRARTSRRLAEATAMAAFSLAVEPPRRFHDPRRSGGGMLLRLCVENKSERGVVGSASATGYDGQWCVCGSKVVSDWLAVGYGCPSRCLFAPTSCVVRSHFSPSPDRISWSC